jgi:hypothetical protein
MKSLRSLVALLAGILLSVPLVAAAQGSPPANPLAQDQLDGLLAPIALYPDELLTQVLMASTYPLEVVQAARFVKANPTLKGQALDDALKDKTWDPSVLSLAAFPQVLDMMNDQLEWTQRLGDAFLSDEAAVMRTVQSLRQRAERAGNLTSTEQQNVVVQDNNIIIEPAQPEYVYVPVYNPTVIYGPWWAPDYTPWYWYPPPIWGYPPAPPYWGFTAGFYWGTAWPIHRNYWGWARPNWHDHNVNVNFNNRSWSNRPQYRDRYPNGAGSWNHIPEHRKGVAYRDQATYNKYRPTNPAAVQSRENYRGNPQRTPTFPATSAGSQLNRPAPTGSITPAPRPTGPTVGQPVTRPTEPSTGQAVTRPTGPSAGQPTARPTGPTAGQPLPQPTGPTTGQSARQPTGPAVGLPSTRPTSPSVRPPPSPSQGLPMPGSAPTFQMQPRSQVQMESSRGQASRQTMTQPPPSAGRPPSPNGGHSPGPAGDRAPQGRSR